MPHYIPAIGEYVQDPIGHWYEVLEVQANGWRFRVDQVYVTQNSETGETRFRSYGYGPIIVGRSDLRLPA